MKKESTYTVAAQVLEPWRGEPTTNMGAALTAAAKAKEGKCERRGRL